ncbi:MAG TPA: hypothetical protein VKM55_18115 [Candidatus Lokiarchaeia archaeon]|nr:hypothetical protein [Candidatus Lokiarchaeia archaeon]
MHYSRSAYKPDIIYAMSIIAQLNSNCLVTLPTPLVRRGLKLEIQELIIQLEAVETVHAWL